jgi:uncharacterized protein YjiS (DUF1127 family)
LAIERRNTLLRRALIIIVLLLSCSPLSAQSLGQAAGRERERRETAVASASKVFTDEDLRKYGLRPAEAAGQLFSDQQPAAFDQLADVGAQRQDAYRRHAASADAYLTRCEERVRAAKEGLLAASLAGEVGAATRAREVVMNAARALDRARKYRDQADVAARLAVGLPVDLR